MPTSPASLRKALVAVCSACCLALAGCGGGGGGGGPQRVPIEPQTFVLTTADAAGFDGNVDDQQALETGVVLRIGDKQGSMSRSEQAYVSFDLSGIPSGATIDEARLEISQLAVVGEPYDELGALTIVPTDLGATLDGTDRNATPRGAAQVLSSDVVLERKLIDVTAQIAADVAAGRSRAQWRIVFADFEGSFDGAPDRVELQSSAQTPAADVPTLTVEISDGGSN